LFVSGFFFLLDSRLLDSRLRGNDAGGWCWRWRVVLVLRVIVSSGLSHRFASRNDGGEMVFRKSLVCDE